MKTGSFKLPEKTQKILIAPLNWGLGHATRCIPLIKTLLAEKKEVVIASDGEALELLKDAFPDLQILQLPGYHVRYTNTSLISIVARNFINVARGILNEHLELRSLVKKHSPDLIISDSRFGFWNKNVPNIFISHQLKLQSSSKILSWFLNTVNSFFINRFDMCWVPDNSENSLSGALSRNPSIKRVSYIGPLSQFELKTNRVGHSSKSTIKYDIAIILSGPEPARTSFEKKLLHLFKNSDFKIALVRGTNALPSIKHHANITVFNRVNSAKIEEIIYCSNIIVSRSGYTSIMDYFSLGRGAILVPTPGQSEQEYLGRYLNGSHGFKCIEEHDLVENLVNVIDNTLN